MLALLRQRNPAIYLSAHTLATVGIWTSKLGVAWATWELSGSPWWLGLMAWADLFPYLVITPFAGVIADRFDRLVVTRIAQVAITIIAATLTICALYDLLTLPILLALTLAGGIVGAFEQPARLALIVSLVKPRDVPAAIGFNSLTFNLARILGPMLAGPLIVAFGLWSVFAVKVAASALFVVALLMLKPVTIQPRASRAASVLTEIVDGVTYLYRQPGLSAVLLVFLAFCLSGRGILELLPALAERLVGSFGIADSVIALSVLTSAIGVGAILGSVASTTLVRQEASFGIIAATGFASGLAVVVAGFAHQSVVLLAALMLVGGATVVGGVAVQVTLQLAGDPARRGRTTSVYSLFVRGAPGLGALAIGAASELISVEFAFAGAGVAAALISLRYWLRRAAVQATLVFGSDDPPPGSDAPGGADR